MTDAIPLKLTPLQACVLFEIIDGAADAGACEDGLAAYEAEALEQISGKLFRHRDKWGGTTAALRAGEQP